jgi:hypothetical protein
MPPRSSMTEAGHALAANWVPQPKEPREQTPPGGNFIQRPPVGVASFPSLPEAVGRILNFVPLESLGYIMSVSGDMRKFAQEEVRKILRRADIPNGPGSLLLLSQLRCASVLLLLRTDEDVSVFYRDGADVMGSMLTRTCRFGAHNIRPCPAFLENGKVPRLMDDPDDVTFSSWSNYIALSRENDFRWSPWDEMQPYLEPFLGLRYPHFTQEQLQALPLGIQAQMELHKYCMKVKDEASRTALARRFAMEERYDDSDRWHMILWKCMGRGSGHQHELFSPGLLPQEELRPLVSAIEVTVNSSPLGIPP